MLETSLETAADVMTRDVVVVGPDTPLRVLMRQMAERRISGVPVVDDAERLIGMVTEGDIFRWRYDLDSKAHGWLDALAEGTGLPEAFVDWMYAQHEKVRVVMRNDEVVTVTEATPARDIEALLAGRNIKRVPVTRDGRIVGIVARSDLVRLLARSLAPRAA